jgi:hypothetical protein
MVGSSDGATVGNTDGNRVVGGVGALVGNSDG